MTDNNERPPKPPSRESQWVDILHAAHMHGISGNGMHVLLLLKQVGSFQNTDIITRIGTMLNKTGISRRSMQNGLRELREAGVVQPLHTAKIPANKPPLGGAMAMHYRAMRIRPATPMDTNEDSFTRYCKDVITGALRHYENDKPYQWKRWARFLNFKSGNAMTIEHKPEFLVYLNLRQITVAERPVEPPNLTEHLGKIIQNELRELCGLSEFYSGHRFTIGFNDD